MCFWVDFVRTRVRVNEERRREEGEERGTAKRNEGSRILGLLYTRVDRVGLDPVHFS